MKRTTSFGLVLLVAAIAALSGCQKTEGPAEQAGKKLDHAVDKAGQKIEEAGDRLKDATQVEKK
jgi:hypothetical protein